VHEEELDNVKENEGAEEETSSITTTDENDKALRDEFFSFDVDAAPADANIVFLEDREHGDADQGTKSMMDINTVNPNVEICKFPTTHIIIRQ